VASGRLLTVELLERESLGVMHQRVRALGAATISCSDLPTSFRVLLALRVARRPVTSDVSLALPRAMADAATEAPLEADVAALLGVARLQFWTGGLRARVQLSYCSDQ